MADTTAETPAERFKRRDTSRSLLDRLLTGGYGAEQSGERADLSLGAPVPVPRTNKPLTTAPRAFMFQDARPESEDSLGPESELSYLSPSQLLHGLDLAKADELAALAAQRRRTRGLTVNQLLKVR